MPSATDRGLQEYLARYRTGWEEHKAETGNGGFDWEKFVVRARRDKHFSPLNDEEWAKILCELQRAHIHNIEEASVREAIDIATLASGYFQELGVICLPDHSENAQLAEG